MNPSIRRILKLHGTGPEPARPQNHPLLLDDFRGVRGVESPEHDRRSGGLRSGYFIRSILLAAVRPPEARLHTYRPLARRDASNVTLYRPVRWK